MTFPKPPFPRARYQTTFVVHRECDSPAMVDAYEEAIAKAKAELENCGGVVAIDHKHEFVGGQAVMAKAKPNGTPSSTDGVATLPFDVHTDGCGNDCDRSGVCVGGRRCI